MSIASLHQFSKQLEAMASRKTAQNIAENAAPIITRLGLETFDAGQSADGTPWRPGHDGQRATLRKSGDLEKGLKYIAIGTKLRVKLGVAYGKYQIGRRPIFPKQGDPLPATWVRALQRIAVDTVRVMAGFEK